MLHICGWFCLDDFLQIYGKKEKEQKKFIELGNFIDEDTSHVMKKPVLAICEQHRHRSAFASVQSDQHLCCSVLI